jgi:hypothetical protein
MMAINRIVILSITIKPMLVNQRELRFIARLRRGNSTSVKARIAKAPKNTVSRIATSFSI